MSGFRCPAAVPRILYLGFDAKICSMGKTFPSSAELIAERCMPAKVSQFDPDCKTVDVLIQYYGSSVRTCEGFPDDCTIGKTAVHCVLAEIKVSARYSRQAVR